MFGFLHKIVNEFFTNKQKNSMEKEMSEQPDIINKLLRKYIGINFNLNIDLPDNIEGVIIIASGSSYNSAAIVSEFINKIIPFFAHCIYSSEFIENSDFKVDNNFLYIFISQSGETTDTNKSLKIISELTDNTFAVTNTKNSTLYNNAKYKMLIMAGSEKAIASTKAMCAQTFCMFLIACKILLSKNINVKSYIDDLMNVPSIISHVLSEKEKLIKYSENISQRENIIILSSSIFYQLAKEGALKIQELSYINSSAYPLGEFLHGHMAILNKKSAVIFIVNSDNEKLFKDVYTKLTEKYTFESLVIADKSEIDNINSFKINATTKISYLFAVLVLLQITSYQVSSMLNRNIDSPNGLCKIVK